MVRSYSRTPSSDREEAGRSRGEAAGARHTIAMRAAGYEPLEPYPGSGKPWRSRHLPCGNIVSPRPAYLSAGRVGCTACAQESRRAIFQERAGGAERAEADMRSVGLEPLEPYCNSQTPWSCRCTTCGAAGTPRLSAVRNLIKEKVASGCATCNRRARGRRQREANAERAEAMMRAAGYEPLEPYLSAAAPWNCRHAACGEVVRVKASSVRSGYDPCPVCRAEGYKQRAAARRTDPAEATALMRAHGFEPLEPYPGASVGWHCRCTTCGKESRPLYSGVKGRGHRCGHCAGSAPLDPTACAAEMRAAGFEPLEPYPGSDKRWLCRCPAGHEVHLRLTGVRTGKGCRMCATHGIDLAGPAKLYVITHREWNAVKVGIGACTGYTSRLLQHKRQGWELYRARDFTTGAAAYDVEQAVLDRLRGDKLCPFLTMDVMPNGWSETCSSDRVTADEVWAMVEEETRRAPGAYAPRAGARPRAAFLFDAEAAAGEMRARGYEPLVPYPGRTNATWPSRCTTCGHEGRPTFNAVLNGGQGCRICRARAAQAKRAAANAPKAEGVMRAAGFEPLEPYRTSQTPWHCRCTTCSRESTPTYSNVSNGGTRCRFCSAKSSNAERAAAEMQAAGFQPLVPYPGRTTDPWNCRCSCGNKVTTRLSFVRSGTTGCKKCPRAGGRTDPATAAAEARRAGFEPLETYPGMTTDRWRCRCACGTEVTVALTNIRRGRTRCGTCSKDHTDGSARTAASP
ncbi:hypothetical protein ACFV14_24045 [Streptomyces zaomyceticus]|uniref:hypothetical protein n=1 Tax=Streptomyces zaomyceticus TaxID=68286 RepID=UPI0036960AD9